ncbi:MAG: hypothetical protein GWP74_02730 [Proteobacteria bacterium]|nr:hypothetical protein [Pseudomonadota bacterium]
MNQRQDPLATELAELPWDTLENLAEALEVDMTATIASACAFVILDRATQPEPTKTTTKPVKRKRKVGRKACQYCRCLFFPHGIHTHEAACAQNPDNIREALDHDLHEGYA